MEGHYQKATDLFSENKKRTSGIAETEDEVLHDMNAGLVELSAGIQADLAEIKTFVKEIRDVLKKQS